MILRLFTCTLLVSSLSAQDKVPFQDFGEQFVSALSNNDIVKYSQCWMSQRRLLAIVSRPGSDISPREKAMIANYNEYFDEINRQVAYSFGVLVKTLSDAGDLADLRLLSIDGDVSERNGQ